MGGKALQTGSVRLPAARYREVERALVALLRARFAALRIEAIVAYADKPDFGDLDLLVADGPGYDAAALAAALGALEVVANGDVTSVGVPLPEGVFQVDLIRIAPASFDFAARYFGYNDMGNLIGRVAHQFGAKFGHLGLLYQIRDPDNAGQLIAQVSITDDFAGALTLLGYDAARYQALHAAGALRTLDDIFAFVVSSPYVNKAIYLLDERSHKARIRDAKRPTYQAFLRWLDARAAPALPAYAWGAPGTALRAAQCDAFLQAAFARFPPFRERHAHALAQAARARQLKLNFNGALVARLTGLTGPRLGDLMTRLREGFGDQAGFESFILGAGSDAIEERIVRESGRA
jgi:hypothetical protein